MSRYFLDVVREEAAELFPPEPSRRKSELEPFNISKFTELVFGPGTQKAWRRIAAQPHSLTLDVAAKMADVLGRPLSEMISEANRAMRKAMRDTGNQERSGTLGA